MPASVRGCGLPDQQRRHGRGSADQGAAARQEGGQVSCGWWRAGHVTAVLTSYWSGGCRLGPGDTARRRLAAAGVTGTISTWSRLTAYLHHIYIISTLYLFHIYAGAARRAPAPARQCRAPGETTGSWFRIFILNYQINGKGHGEGINWSD